MPQELSFDGVVFAGGGTRCFWQLGFWSVAQPALSLRPRAVSAVSAGSAMACAALLGRCQQTLEQFKEITRQNPSNVHWRNLWRQEPLFPHYRLYRQAMLDAVDDAALQQLQRTTQLLILICRPPALPLPLALTLGLGGYLVNRAIRDTPHPQLAQRFGFATETADVGQCQTSEQLADLVLASSCTPPFTPALRLGDKPVLDGGVIDSAPADLIAPQCNHLLVLLTRRYQALPQQSGRLYLHPSQPIAISKWDYSSPDLLQQTYDLGRRDAERFLEGCCA